MNTAAIKKEKRLSEQLLEAQAILQDLARMLQREFKLLVECQKQLSGESELRLF